MRSWYSVRAQGAPGEPARMSIFDEIGLWGVTAADFAADLARVRGDVELHLNSPGGDVFDGIAILNALREHPGRVTVVVDGLAASSASFIAMAASPGCLEVAANASMMIHDAWGMTIGNAADMRQMADLLDAQSANIAAIYAARSGRTPEEHRAAMAAESWYIGQQAVDAGLADRVREGAPAMQNRFDLSRFRNAPAGLRNAGPEHEPMTGRHSHPHSDMDGDRHEHEHEHDGDADHAHAHRDRAQARRSGRVLGIESMPLADKALPVHHTATEDGEWDGPAAVAAMPSDGAVLRYCHAWEDSEAASADDGSSGDDHDADDEKKNYKFPHHKTKGGPAFLAACRNGLARLSRADIPDEDRAGVEAHLRAHLKDGGGDAGEKDHADIPAWLRDA